VEYYVVASLRNGSGATELSWRTTADASRRNEKTSIRSGCAVLSKYSQKRSRASNRSLCHVSDHGLCERASTETPIPFVVQSVSILSVLAKNLQQRARQAGCKGAETESLCLTSGVRIGVGWSSQVAMHVWPVVRTATTSAQISQILIWIRTCGVAAFGSGSVQYNLRRENHVRLCSWGRCFHFLIYYSIFW